MRNPARVLVANRGEIAVRIIRACRVLGIESVAVFTPEDRDTPAPALADYAYPLPEGGYLDPEAIFTAARRTLATAIHPGYGFFAENAGFIEACAQRGILFVGPSATAARALGDKIECRRVAARVGVPTLPGGDDPVSSPEAAADLADAVGYPVLIKASAGGGGRGIRIARDRDEVLRAVESASKEGERLFLDGRVFVERYLEGARHIEIQLLADQHGNVVHIGERDCSVQRRRQKIVEEAPGPLLPAQRAKMGADAIRMARAVGYSGLGTAEFLFMPDGSYYLLEVNTRLQVEHPVSEAISGRDLIAEQIRVAFGARLSFTQDDLALSGHAIELRVTAEDPSQNYAAATGTVSGVRWPGGPGVRVDAGVSVGTKVSARFDPLLVKIIVHGRDRADAIQRALCALDELQIGGVATNAPLLKAILSDPAFQRGQIDTQYLDRFLVDAPISQGDARRSRDLAAILGALAARGLLPRPQAARAPRKGSRVLHAPMIL